MSDPERRRSRGRRVDLQKNEPVAPRPLTASDNRLPIPVSQDIRTVVTAPDPEALKEASFDTFQRNANVETATRLYTTQMLGSDTATSIAIILYFCSGVVQRDRDPEARKLARRLLATFHHDVARRGELHRNLLYHTDEFRDRELGKAEESMAIVNDVCDGQDDLEFVPAFLRRYYAALEERQPYASIYVGPQGEIGGEQRELLEARTNTVLNMRDAAFQAFPSLSGSYLSAESAIQIYRMPEDLLAQLEAVPQGQFVRPEQLMFTHTSWTENSPRTIQGVRDREDRNQRILTYLSKRFLGDSMYLALGEVLYLLPRGHITSLDGLSPEQRKAALVATDFQAWITDKLLMPGLTNNPADRQADKLILDAMNTLTEQESIFGNIAIQTALFGQQSLRLLGQGQPGQLQVGSGLEVRAWAERRLGRPIESEGEAVQMMVRMIQERSGAIQRNLIERFGRDNRIRGITQNALKTELDFARASPLRLARAVGNSRQQETMATMASGIIVPEGAYYSHEVPAEFRNAGLLHIEDTGIRRGSTPETANRVEQLRQLIRYEKGRAMQYLAHTLLGLALPDRVVAPEMALRVGLDGETGYHAVRADGAVLRMTPETGEIINIDMIVEDKWGLAPEAIWNTLLQQDRELTAPEYATARRILVRMKSLQDPAFDSSPDQQLRLRRIGLVDLQHDHDRQPGVIEQITVEDIITGLRREDRELADAAEAIMHLETIFQHGSSEDRLSKQLEALRALKTALFASLEQGNELLRHPQSTPNGSPQGRFDYLKSALIGIANRIDAVNPERLIRYLQETSSRGNPDSMLLFLLNNKLIRHDLRIRNGNGGREVVERGRRSLDTDMTSDTADFLTVVANSEVKVMLVSLVDQMLQGDHESPMGITRDQLLNRFARLQGQKRRDDMRYKHAWDYCTRLAAPQYGIFRLDEQDRLHLTEKGARMAGIAGHLLDLSAKYGRNLSLTDTLGYANLSGYDDRESGSILNTRPARTAQILEVIRNYPEGISPDDLLVNMEEYTPNEVLNTLEDLAQNQVLTVGTNGLLHLRARRFRQFVDLVSGFNSLDPGSESGQEFLRTGREKAATIFEQPDQVNRLLWKSSITSHYSVSYRPLDSS